MCTSATHWPSFGEVHCTHNLHAHIIHFLTLMHTRVRAFECVKTCYIWDSGILRRNIFHDSDVTFWKFLFIEYVAIQRIVIFLPAIFSQVLLSYFEPTVEDTILQCQVFLNIVLRLQLSCPSFHFHFFSNSIGSWSNHTLLNNLHLNFNSQFWYNKLANFSSL